MAGKFYAVKVGRNTGIFNTWEECKLQVDGYPGATYKSFKTVNEAAEFLGWKGNTKSAVNSSSGFSDNSCSNCSNAFEPATANEAAIAYVDGSYNIATGDYGYGVVFFFNGKEIHLKKGFSNDVLASMRNVAGEIKGSEAAISYALENNIKSIKIYHDYEGISKWCTGEWKANKEGTIAYKNFYNEAAKKINIEFIKVKGHSGDKYNDVADSLAKAAAGVTD
ncbi:MAG: ribonuclease H family protein [Lachnospiraceae bacterium]|nr:ribonuclease H family protein [Lachnospiraceae bacterium]